MWLEDMTQTFRTRYTQWKKDHDACQTAGTMIAPQEALCSVKERALNEHAQECGRALDSMESFSCSWATGFAARCSAYDTCFASVLTRHSDAVREANESVVRWRKSWLAAPRMECMANAMRAMNISDSADRAKVHVCSNENITNTSFIKVVVPDSDMNAFLLNLGICFSMFASIAVKMFIIHIFNSVQPFSVVVTASVTHGILA